VKAYWRWMQRETCSRNSHHLGVGELNKSVKAVAEIVYLVCLSSLLSLCGGGKREYKIFLVVQYMLRRLARETMARVKTEVFHKL
jgi:hypothetical protein